jgi:signal transduction histidine kinase
MTRRLAIAILLTVWTVLLAGGLTAYLTIRSLLIADLDAVLFARAASLPELVQGQQFDPQRIPQYDWSDIYTIRDDAGRSISAGGDRTQASPTLVSAAFTNGPDGRRVRSIVVRSVSREMLKPVTVTYQGSAEHVDALLHRLAIWLLGFCGAAGLITAAVAMVVSRRMSKAIRDTADLMGAIDEQKLDRRMISRELPPEMEPVAERLNQMLDRLEHAFAQRKRLLAGASHQLSTPLASLLKAIESTAPYGPAARDVAMNQCLPQLRVLRRLVERLVELVQTETAGADLVETTDASKLLNQCCDAAAELAGSRNIRVIRSIPSDLKCHISAPRLRSVVSDLLFNAVEYNKAGGRVEISCLHDSRQLRIRISDDGPGIAPEFRPQLFQPFGRAGRGPDERHLGLGLFLAQSHVRALEGRIRLDSSPKDGTAVEIELPCARLHVPSDALPAARV